MLVVTTNFGHAKYSQGHFGLARTIGEKDTVGETILGPSGERRGCFFALKMPKIAKTRS